jgi:branched-chain amino acid transport system permease protein
MVEALIINGLLFGGMYSLLAIGFSLVFGVAKILNLAHTAFYMIAAFLAYIATMILGLPLLLSAILAIIVTSILAMVCYKLCFDRIKEHETAVIIVSVAIGILIQEVLLLIFSGHFRRIPPFVSGFMEIVGIRVAYQNIFAIAASILTLSGVWFLLTKTKFGIALRAVAQDREIANLSGINVSQICMITMGISGILAGIAAVIIGSIFLVSPLMWLTPLIIVLAAVVLGGLGSLKGSVFAAFILGFAEATVTCLIPGGSFLKGAISLSVMVGVLLIRPEGLFGVVFEEERL